eukprot:189066_1
MINMTNMITIHQPLAITHGNNILFLLFSDGNIWSSYNNHLLEPEPFKPDSSKINPLDPTHKNPKLSIDSTAIETYNENDNKNDITLPSPMLSEIDDDNECDIDIIQPITPLIKPTHNPIIHNELEENDNINININ